jgi:hypothetical protein
MEQIATEQGHLARAFRRGLLGCALALVLAGPVFAKDWKVGSPQELTEALSRIAAGDVVEIAPGNYPALTLYKKAGEPEAPIVIRSADPEKAARIETMDLREVSHLVLENLTFDYTYPPGDAANTRPFQVFTTRDLQIRDSLFDGDVAPPDPVQPELGPLPTGFGLALRSSTEITLSRNEFRGFYRGAIITDCTDLTLQDNDIHAMRMDGLNFAQVERVRIAGNHIHDFRRAIDTGDHADMIQFWTAGTERPSRDIVIAGNVLNSGLGGFTQSILMRNELVDRGEAGEEMFFRNVEIRDNVIVNAHLHGITVGQADGVKVENNTLIHNVFSEGETRDPVLWIPQIRVAKTSRDVTIARNAVSEIAGPVGQADWRVSGNLLIQDTTPGRADFYDALFVAARTGLPDDLTNFSYLPGGALAGSGVGAPMLDTLDRTHGFQPVMRFDRAPEGGLDMLFDARKTLLPDGVNPEEVRYDWTIAQTGKIEGADVPLRFAEPGIYNVALKVTLPDGRAASSSGRIAVIDERVVSYDPQLGRIISHVGAEPEALDTLPLSPGAIEFGRGDGALEIPPGMIAPFFGADRFNLHLRLRAMGDYKSAGELLRVHQSLFVKATGRGSFTVDFRPETGQRLFLRTKAIALFDGEWHDITLRYSSRDKLFEVLAGDEVIGKGTVSGRVRKMEYWGLAFGNPFGNKDSFHGELSAIDLDASGPTVTGAMR